MKIRVSLVQIPVRPPFPSLRGGLLKTDISNQSLISHRFRGFSSTENTIEGLLNALDYGVAHVEFDVRIAACGTPVVYHDEFIMDDLGHRTYLHKYKASSYPKLGDRFAKIPTLDRLLSRAADHKNKSTKLLIDIKDFGLETAIHALVMSYNLQNRVVYVSWLPEVLYALDHLEPTIPKCFSHWSQPVNRTIRSFHRVYNSKDGLIPKPATSQIIGQRSGWEVLSPIKGRFLKVLQRSNGGVCVPRDMITRPLSQYYHDKGLFVSTFAYTSVQGIEEDYNNFNIDLYFVDNKIVFDKLL